MLPRFLIRLFFAIVAVVVAWGLFVAAWFALPSNPPSLSRIVTALKDGGVVTRVYDAHKVTGGFLNSGSSHFALAFNFQKGIKHPSGEKTLGLVVGGWNDYVDGIIDTKRSDGEMKAYISLELDDLINGESPTHKLQVPSTSPDLALSPKGLSMADYCLLSRPFHHRWTEIELITRFDLDGKRVELHAINPNNIPDSPSPLISIVLAEDLQNVTIEFPDAPTSASPTSTYKFRLFLLPFVEALPFIALGLLFFLNMLIWVVFLVLNIGWTLASFALTIFTLYFLAVWVRSRQLAPPVSRVGGGLVVAGEWLKSRGSKNTSPESLPTTTTPGPIHLE